MLYRKFHETVLNHFGFRNFVQQNSSTVQQNVSQTFQPYTVQQHNQPPLPPPPMAQTHSGLPRRERSLSNESRKREKSVERAPNMMKRETNNSRVNLEGNNSMLGNKPKQNPSTVTVVTQPQKSSIQAPPVQQNERVPPPQQVYAPQNTYTQPQQQQVNTSNASSNFLSQTHSVQSSRANQSDPFASYPQSQMNRIPQPQQTSFSSQ
jgi:hypothetical protein